MATTTKKTTTATKPNTKPTTTTTTTEVLTVKDPVVEDLKAETGESEDLGANNNPLVESGWVKLDDYFGPNAEALQIRKGVIFKLGGAVCFIPNGQVEENKVFIP